MRRWKQDLPWREIVKYRFVNIVMFKNVKNIYMVGIKGVGMTALAQILVARGMEVSGSDTDEKFFTDKVLSKLNIKFTEGFDENNVPTDADLIISSVAYINSDNVEIAEAEKRKMEITTYPQALAELFNDSYGIAVAGSHGKSTTSAMLGFILEYAGEDPTVVVGSRVNQWSSNARADRGKYFVIEADEYRDAFLQYEPKMILLTNIDYDHPDYFPTEKSYNMSFKNFTDRVPTDKLIQTTNLEEKFNLQLPGRYNQENAYLAYRAALKLGVVAETAREALEKFEGLARRFESYGRYMGALLFDDYAHHPYEVKSLLEAVREKYKNKKIIILFQPHTFTRTQILFDDFTKAFVSADNVYILKTYTSAREEGEDVWGEKLANAIGADYFEDHKTALEHFKKELSDDMVFLTVGAGDGWQILEGLRDLT